MIPKFLNATVSVETCRIMLDICNALENPKVLADAVDCW
jgi:hypothetical protein